MSCKPAWLILCASVSLFALLPICLVEAVEAADEPASYRSHPPQRPLPQPSQEELVAGPKRFVDAVRGDDKGAGSAAAPWQTLEFALRQLKPGETLYLRGG